MKVVTIGSEVVVIGSEVGAIGSEPIANNYEQGENCFLHCFDFNQKYL